MDKKYKVLIGVIIVIGVILLINEFVLIPIFPSPIISASCLQPFLFNNEYFPEKVIPTPPGEGSFRKSPGLVNMAELILTGTAGDSEWVVFGPRGKNVETHTETKVDDVIKGQYSDDEIMLRSFGGCNKRFNYCKDSSNSIKPKKDTKYLLFLSDPNEDGVYGGFSSCGGIYEITLDDFGNEKVRCFAEDIQDCIEKEITCPESPNIAKRVGSPTVEDRVDDKPDVEDSEGNNIPQPARKCISRYVLLEDLIKQIK